MPTPNNILHFSIVKADSALKRSIGERTKIVSFPDHSADWKHATCELEMVQLMDFIEVVRGVALSVYSIMNRWDESLYLETLEKIKGQMIATDAGHLTDAAPGEERWHITTWIIRNISRILPTEENDELVRGFYRQLEDRTAEIESARNTPRLVAMPRARTQASAH